MTPASRPYVLVLLAAVLAAGAAWAAQAQAPQPAAPASTVVSQAAKPSVSTKEPIRPAAVRTAPPPKAESKPTWGELTVHQQQALAPLAVTWRTLGEAHKRKWLALSENFHSMPPPEQARMHSRMTEWAALSPQQRTAARLNFAEAQKVAPNDKRAKWEAYQALPPEEKKKLQQRAAATKPPPPPTALAVHPVPREKLARIPTRGRKGEPPVLPVPSAAPAPVSVAPPLPALPAPAESNALLPTPASPVAP